MNKSIAVTISHDLGAAEARRRIEAALDALQRRFAGKFAEASAVWTGDHADIHVVAMGQVVDAGLDVESALVRIEVALPWLLAVFAEKARGLIQKTGEDALRLPPPN